MVLPGFATYSNPRRAAIRHVRPADQFSGAKNANDVFTSMTVLADGSMQALIARHR
jgi:hypothetical protein